MYTSIATNFTVCNQLFLLQLQELQKSNQLLERPAPLVPSGEELIEMEQASATAAEVTSTMLKQRMELDAKKRSIQTLQKALVRIILNYDILDIRLFFIISPSEVIGDIMVLASPPPPRPPPVDPDDVNTPTRKIFNESLSNLYEGRYPLSYVAIEI